MFPVEKSHLKSKHEPLVDYVNHITFMALFDGLYKNYPKILTLNYRGIKNNS